MSAGDDLHAWQRLEHEGLAVWVHPDKPDWLVPNAAADGLLRALRDGGQAGPDWAGRRFLERLPDGNAADYAGRAAYLHTEHLRELWLHLTDRCNQSCRHCLFSCSSKQAATLPEHRALAIADEAAALGCRVFALTGGEPLVHPGFAAIVDGLLAHAGSHVVVLTNGSLLREQAATLQRWPADRLHLQISADGLAEQHDAARGAGAFAALQTDLRWLHSLERSFTLSMYVGPHNAADMPGVVDFAADCGAASVHFTWHLPLGRGARSQTPPLHALFAGLTTAAERAERRGIGLDNIDAMRSQVFAPSGTIHDGSNGGWESVAVGPDGKLYPSPALIGRQELGTGLDAGLARAWRESRVLDGLREISASRLDSPLRYLVGGGDPDHAYAHGASFAAGDPYLPLHERLALWLIARRAQQEPDGGPPRLRLKMGDVLESCASHGRVALTHSNCLLSLAQRNSRSVVRAFYSDAAAAPRTDILNPAPYPDALLAHIPGASRVRSYGCGSPVLDADLSAGERVVDLGSGSGVECFIAARLVGPEGRVTGVDMLQPMLELARAGAAGVADKLGYDNLAFVDSVLEQIALPASSADVVMSNCVINLAQDKRRVFAEALRILRPGGRLVVADVVCQTEPSPAIRNDEALRGECIAGALPQRDLFALLDETGFSGARVLQLTPYRRVRGHPFFSLTFAAYKPAATEPLRAVYRGPFAAVLTRDGRLAPAGVPVELDRLELAAAGDEMLQLDEAGRVSNVEMNGCCGCAEPPAPLQAAPVLAPAGGDRHAVDCMCCGAELEVLSSPRPVPCVYCGRSTTTAVLCRRGHFVCDACHTRDGLATIRHICAATDETDMLALMRTIRQHPALPLHGPEHHALVPAVILTTYRNRGGALPAAAIDTGIERGAQVAGGACAFWGACGAATGVGVGFGVILDANPLEATARQTVMRVTQQVLAALAALRVARCCQRDSWIALREAARLSRELLPVSLLAEARLVCRQRKRNRECAQADCPMLQGGTEPGPEFP